MKASDSHYHLNENLSLDENYKLVMKLKLSLELNIIYLIHLQTSKFNFEDVYSKFSKISNLKLILHVNPLIDYKLNARELGMISGIKLHPRIDKYSLSNPLVSELLSKLTGKNLFVITCTFWDGTWQNYGLSETDFFQLANKFPSINFIWAHSGGIKCLDFMLMAKNCPNVFLDLSFTQHYFPKEIIGNQLIFI
ncbi:MAG: hypothetical protein RLZZ44_1770, partial [Bacteroidota bacterium]